MSHRGSVLVTGGARSGKSSFAEKLCMKRSESGTYVATAQAYDEDEGTDPDSSRPQAGFSLSLGDGGGACCTA